MPVFINKPKPKPVPIAPIKPTAAKSAMGVVNAGKFKLPAKGMSSAASSAFAEPPFPKPQAIAKGKPLGGSKTPGVVVQEVAIQSPVVIPKAKAPLAQLKKKTGVSVQVIAQETTTEVPLSELSDEQLADVYGTLQDEVKAVEMNPVLTRFNEVTKELDSRTAQLDGSETAEWVGDHWTVSIGAATKAPPEITDMQKAANLMGAEAFWKCCKITLADLKKYLNPEQLAQVTKTDTGYIKKRKVEATFRG